MFCLSKHFLALLSHRDLKVTARTEHPAFLSNPVFSESCLRGSHCCQTQITYCWCTFCRSRCWRNAAWELNSGRCCSVVVHLYCCFFLHVITHRNTPKCKLLFQSRAHQWRNAAFIIVQVEWKVVCAVTEYLLFSRDIFRYEQSVLEDQSQGCVIKAVNVCGHCLVSRGGGGGGDDLMPWGSRTRSWRLNSVYHCSRVCCARRQPWHFSLVKIKGR